MLFRSLAVTCAFNVCPEVPAYIGPPYKVSFDCQGALPGVVCICGVLFNVFGVFKIVIKENVPAAFLKGDSWPVVISNKVVLNSV